MFTANNPIKYTLDKSDQKHRDIQRFQREFSVIHENIRYKGYDISRGGLSFFTDAASPSFAKGKILGIVIEAKLGNRIESMHASIRIASLRSLSNTSTNVYGCSFKSITDPDFIRMLIEGQYTRTNHQASSPVSPKTEVMPKPKTSDKIANGISHNIVFFNDIIEEMERKAFDEYTNDEEFRAHTVVSLNEIRKLIKASA